MQCGVQEPADVGHEDHGVHGGRALLLGRQSQRTPNHVLGQALGDLPADSGKQGRRDARHGLSSKFQQLSNGCWEKKTAAFTATAID
jgi:hypothetical protein